jgi:hypothetical protein
MEGGLVGRQTRHPLQTLVRGGFNRLKQGDYTFVKDQGFVAELLNLFL